MKITGNGLLFLAVIFVLSGCSSDDGPNLNDETETRSFLMGFTAFPYDLDINAVNETVTNVVRDGDIFLNHFDFGVPWDEVRNDEAFPNEVLNAIEIAKTNKSNGTKILLTATPTDQTRENLAKYWNDNGTHEPLPPFWEGRAFNDAEVKATYLKYCRRIIDEVQPDYFAYGIETNAAFRKDDAGFMAFLELAQETYTALKADYPSLPIFLSIQDQSFNNTKAELLETSEMILQYSDYIAISTYPFFYYQDLTRDANPDLFADDWLSDFRNLDTTKPFAVSENRFCR